MLRAASESFEFLASVRRLFRVECEYTRVGRVQCGNVDDTK